jgi:PAS domain S-box-containing protein
MFMLKTLMAWIKENQIKHISGFSFFLLLYVLIIFALSGTGGQKFEHLHLLLDTSNGLLSLLLALFLLAEQYNIQHNVRNYLAIAFAFAAFTELLHAFVGIEWVGEFAWIASYAQLLRPVTWPPSTYVLPLALLCSIWLMRRDSNLHSGIFAVGMGLITITLYALSFNIPAYIDTGILGIQRPSQIPLLIVLLVLISVCWHERRRSPLFEGLAWMGILLFVSDSFMLFSTSPHEKFTMMAHAGKLLAYVFMHVVQMRMAMEDSRARQKAESALLLEKNMLRKAMDELAFLQFALDQHSIVGVTNVEGTITFVNDSFCRISGYSRAELIGQNHRLISSGEHSKEFFREMYRTIASGDVWQGEFCNRAKDGHLYWVKTSIVPLLDEQGKPEQYVSIRTDISEQKRVERELLRYQNHLEELVAEQIFDLKQAKEAAEAASRAKSHFLANMSHEIRTPMNGVVGVVDILQETKLTPEQQRMVNTIRTSSLALLGILGDILDFSKIEAGKLEIELIPVNLREQVEGVAQLLAPSVADKNMDLIVFIHPDIPAWVRTDPGRLRQILFNLLSNAVKFTKNDAGQRGQVLLRVERSVFPDNQDALLFRVIDNGIGMTDETMEQLFRPFVQADETTTRRFGGTGLGLSISKHLAELLHGTIQVNSTFGSGSEFDVTLPLEAVPAGHTPVAVSDLSGLNVWVVTVHPVYADILPLYLRAAGAGTKVFKSQQALLDAYRCGEKCEAALLDLTLDSFFDTATSNNISKALPSLPVVLLVSRRVSAIPGNELVISANPLLFDELTQALDLVSRRHTVKDVVQKSERRSQSRKNAPTIEEAVARNELILVAEDNDVSQEVIQEQLRILGYAAETVGDGRAALEKWRSGRYSLLLTDCHMPYLDGFGLTEAIRKEEPEGMHTRIIAVTGNAMHGEALRCLSHGMDDYLAKPLRLSELGVKLAKWLPQKKVEIAPEPTSEAQSSKVATAIPVAADAVWDATTLTRMVGDYPAMHRRLLDKFIVSSEEHVAAILASAAAADMETVVAVAHKMKSAARTVGAMQLGTLCQELEASGKKGDVQAVTAHTADLEAAFSEVVTQIKNSYCAQ